MDWIVSCFSKSINTVPSIVSCSQNMGNDLSDGALLCTLSVNHGRPLLLVVWYVCSVLLVPAIRDAAPADSVVVVSCLDRVVVGGW